MDDRKASLVAAAFGSVAIGGFWLARPMKPTGTLRIIDQWAPTTRVGPDGDAAAMFRVSLKGAVREDDGPILYRVVGKDGVAYPLVPAASPGSADILKLSRGYARRLDSPRLVATADGRSVASAELRPLPIPEAHPLTPTSNSPVKLVLRGGAGLFAEPKRAIPANERWRVVARRTPFADGLEAVSGVTPPEARFTRQLSVPFPDEAKLVEVEMTRYRMVPESEVVRVSGLRLERRFGGTATVVDRQTRIANRLGADIRLPEQDNGPRHPLRNGDNRIATANLYVVPDWMSDLPPDLRRGRGVRIDVLQPSPESLGLREIRIGPHSRRSEHAPTGPIHEGPFEASLRITFFRPVPIDTRRMVLPVTVGSPPMFPGTQIARNMPFQAPN